MGDEVLTLNTAGGRLWRTIREPIARALDRLDGGPYECRLGGGTTLAARWRHRDSYDVDLTVPGRTNLGNLRHDFERTMTELGGEARYLVGRWTIAFEGGRVDLAALDPCPGRGQRTAAVDGEPFTVLSNAQILHGKLERGHRSPVRDVFDVVKARDLDPHALAVAVNCRNQSDAEVISVSWEKANARLEEDAATQLAGIPEDMEEDHATLGMNGAAALAGAIYRHVAVYSEDGVTAVETRTRDGVTRRMEMARDEIDPSFAANGLDEYFYQNVIGGNRIREMARDAARTAGPARTLWETGQIPPPFETNSGASSSRRHASTR